MLFNSFDFLWFFLVVLGVYWTLPQRPRKWFLLAASNVFYACWDWRFLGLLWVTIVLDYTVARLLDATSSNRRRKLLITLSCVTNLGILGFFKYAGFFADSARQFAGLWEIDLPAWTVHVILPVGISFYTFQSMSYSIDVYRREMPALKNLFDYALYVTLFPQLVAGPIERGTHLATQVLQPKFFSWTAACDGSWLILKGLFKKVVLADNLAAIVDQIFSSPSPTGPEVLLGVYAFTFQIYGDFAGYTDMARGIGKWLGYELMLNFRLPYFAVDPSDFWRRWHISLSTWLRDYLYIPLGGNRGGLLFTCRNLLLTMLLGGLWHGANWTYVAWGAYHGLLLMAFRIWTAARPATAGHPVSRPQYGARWLMQVVLMFHLTCFGWLLFRAASLTQVGQMLTALGTWTIAAEYWVDVWRVAILVIPVVLVQFLEEVTGELELVPRLSWLPRSIAYASIMLAIVGLGSFGGREFIYFQF
jgi:alginate O-acetyltransferase complex protein AlgI